MSTVDAKLAHFISLQIICLSDSITSCCIYVGGRRFIGCNLPGDEEEKGKEFPKFSANFISKMKVKRQGVNSPRTFFRLRPHVAYGCLALFISLLNNVFLLFYVATFVNVFQIDSLSFWIGETIFLVWNSVNDPVFGWLSDRQSLCEGGSMQKESIVLRRVRALSINGPLFAASFLLFWFPILPISIQFSLSLCLFDSFLTMVDLHHQALLADITINDNQRATLNSYCSRFSALGSLSVFVSYSLWDKHDMATFRIFCMALSVFVAVGFLICCNSLKEEYSQKDLHISNESVHEKYSTKSEKATDVSLTEYMKQVLKHKNFLWFAAMNLIQVFHCHFNSNFFPLFIEHLLGKSLTPAAGATLLGLSFLIPHINNLYFLRLCQYYGVYAIIKWLFYIKLALAVIMWGIGCGYWIILCIFIASNRIFTEGTCKLLSLVISDLVDEDFVKFRRKGPVSALVFGTSALFSKPGQTLAPLLGSYILYLQTGKSLFFDRGSGPIISKDKNLTVEEFALFRTGCFNVLVYVPVLSALLQIFIWRCFTLQGPRLKSIKDLRANLERDQAAIDLV